MRGCELGLGGFGTEGELESGDFQVPLMPRVWEPSGS